MTGALIILAALIIVGLILYINEYLAHKRDIAADPTAVDPKSQKTAAADITTPESAEGDDVISWECVRRPITELPRIDTYGDHRMAMAFAPLAVFIPGIIINDIEVVSKSYPDYWSHLTEAGFRLIDAETPLTDINEEA